jgi:hypothetical protein
LLRWTNGYFLGMTMFYLMFTYGLWAAIAIHIFYDVLLSTVVFVEEQVHARTRQ